MKFLKTYEDRILDNILDKIGLSGKDNLTDLEKQYLDKYSKGQSTKGVQDEMNKKEYSDEIGPYEARIILKDVEDVEDQVTELGNYQRWNGTLYVGDKEYDGFIGFKNGDYLHGYFQSDDNSDIYTDLNGLEYEIDQFCENAFYSLVKESFLFENRIEDIEKKFYNAIGRDVIKFFKEGDPTDNKSYFYWMCDRWSKYKNNLYANTISHTGEVITWFAVVNMIKKYHRIKQKIEEKQIDKIESIEELDKILSKNTIFETLLDEKKEDVKILYNTSEWIVFIPYTEEISKTYGDTTWCTVYAAEEHFEKHFGNYGALIYFMNKLDSKNNFALEQTADGKSDVWDTSDEKIIENESLHDIISILKAMQYPVIIDVRTLLKDWDEIVEKIPPAKMTENKYMDFMVEIFKKEGVGRISRQWGAEPIFSSLDLIPKYKDLMSEITNKLIEKKIKQPSKIRQKLLCNIIEEDVSEMDQIIKSIPLDERPKDCEWKYDILIEIGVPKLIDILTKINILNKVMKKYIDEYYGGTGHLEDKFFDAFGCNEDTIEGEGEALLEKYINWKILMSNLVQEMEEEDYFAYIDQIDK